MNLIGWTEHLIPGGAAAPSARALLHAAQAPPLQLPHAPRLLPQSCHLLPECLYGLPAQYNRSTDAHDLRQQDSLSKWGRVGGHVAVMPSLGTQ